MTTCFASVTTRKVQHAGEGECLDITVTGRDDIEVTRNWLAACKEYPEKSFYCECMRFRPRRGEGITVLSADPFPDEWHTADERDMWAEGWILDYVDRPYCGPSAIFATTEETRMCADNSIRFASDDEALSFVQQRAAEGAPHALKALRIVAGELGSVIPPMGAPR
jgi:hypothetical protein